jgi:hypothetical protein
MGNFSIYYLCFYLLLSSWNWFFKRFDKPEEQQSTMLKKDLLDWKRKKQDDLGWFINELAD